MIVFYLIWEKKKGWCQATTPQKDRGEASLVGRIPSEVISSLDEVWYSARWMMVWLVIRGWRFVKAGWLKAFWRNLVQPFEATKMMSHVSCFYSVKHKHHTVVVFWWQTTPSHLVTIRKRRTTTRTISTATTINTKSFMFPTTLLQVIPVVVWLRYPATRCSLFVSVFCAVTRRMDRRVSAWVPHEIEVNIVVKHDSKCRVIMVSYALQMGVSKNNGTPQIIHFNRVFHYFHHPFWGFPPIFGLTPKWM